MNRCIGEGATHHFACDCREAEFAAKDTELALLREFVEAVRRIECVRSQEFADGDSLDEDILVGMLRDVDSALVRLDEGRKG